MPPGLGGGVPIIVKACKIVLRDPVRAHDMGSPNSPFSLTPAFLFNYKFIHLVHLKSMIRFKSIMVRSNKIVQCVFYTLLTLSFLSSCATYKRPHSEDGNTPVLLMKEGLDNFDKGRYEKAIRKFEKIVLEFPYSDLADKAMLKLADAYYKSEEHYSALAIYRMVEKRHPNHPDLPYVIFRQGMCLFNEVKSVDKNQSLIRDARGEFERLDQRYPGSDFAEKAQEKMRECDELMARYELQVGHFYYNGKKYRAAIGRYAFVMKNYPHVDSYQEALAYAKKSREILNLPEERKDPAQRPRRQETVIASQKTEETKSKRAPESAPPMPVTTRPSPQNEKQPEILQPGKSMQTITPRMAFSVQVGAFSVRKNAERLVADLTRKRYRPFILKLSGYGNTRLYSVRILNCRDSKEAFRAAFEYREKEGSPAIVTAVDSLDSITPGRWEEAREGF